MVEILHNNYQIPIYSIEDQDNIIKIIHSKEFNDIYSFYASQIPAGSRLEQLPDYEKRMGFYLYYTGQDQFLSQVNNLLYKKHMPTIQEFLKDDAYMGNSYAIIYPYWRDVLAKIFDPSNQYFECVFRGSIGCLNGDTCILVDNKKVTLRDLAKKGSDYTFNVISFDIENNRLIQTKATNARVTGKNRKQISISLSDGTVINSTYDHRYLLSNSKYVHAEDLNIGDCIKSSNKSYIVRDVRYIEEKADVYDIEVPQYHNFGVLTKSGDLVFLHNSGKSTIARRGLIYSLYRICCLRSPHKLFNIAPDTVLSALMISVTLQQAQDTALKPVLEMIRNSPCFHEVRKMTSFDAFGPGDPVPFCRQGNGIRFPNNVYLSVGSNINHIIGYSVFGCLTGETQVVTNKGNVSIEQLSKDWSNYKVKTLEKDHTCTWNSIKNCECTKEVNELIEIELENGQIIRCTQDHKFPIKNPKVGEDTNLILYNNQWCKKAKDLTEFDELVD